MTLRTLLDQRVVVPNRNVAQINRYRHGYVRAWLDVQVPDGAAEEDAVRVVETVVRGAAAQREVAQAELSERILGSERGGGANLRGLPLAQEALSVQKAVEQVDLGPGQGRHEALPEGAVALVDHALRLRRDGAEHQRALAGTRDTGDADQQTERDLDIDGFEVVLGGAAHLDAIALTLSPSALGHGDGPHTREVLPSQRAFSL